MRRDTSDRLSLLGITLAGLALRLFRLGADSLWYDETVSTALAGSPLSELLRHTAGDIHPPGYYIVLRAWLALTGYPTGRADPHGNGLEFVAGFFSLFFGVLLIALIYSLARRVAGRTAALIAAGLVALSPFNIWYSQEVRMYTLGAGLGVVAIYALLRSGIGDWGAAAKGSGWGWWAVYAVAAAAGMYTLYYFIFLLIPLNLWALWQMAQRLRQMAAGRRPHDFISLVLANLAAALLYAPWIPVAWRQATNPPVPPWRAAPNILAALHESWTALSLGQSAPDWLWPVLLLTLSLYGLGVVVISRNQRISESRSPKHENAHSLVLPLATLGPLALILLASLITPLYHVRYLFTYSPAFFVVIAAGLAGCWRRLRPLFAAAALIWLAAAGVTLQAFWTDPTYRADDHRAAVRFLAEHWRPGDVVLVNAGWTYTALTTYWDGPIASRSRLTDPLPAAPAQPHALVVITTGHVDGAAGLGWGDPRSDFFAMSADAARAQIAGLFGRFDRVWHYRSYDTVNDPAGRIRADLAADGQLCEDQIFTGEANMRVQGFAGRLARTADPRWPTSSFGANLTVRSGPLPARSASGETLYPVLDWQFRAAPTDFATSLRLIGPEGAIWAQPPDERPLGARLPASQWPSGQTERQTLALPIPAGTPPGAYTVELVVYDPATGQPLPATGGELPATANGVRLGSVTVARPQTTPPLRPALGRFGPLALIEASSPATAVAPGGQIPVELLWQAVATPQEPLVVVIQLTSADGRVAAGLEAQPVAGRYPTQAWLSGDLVRDQHTLSLPADLPPGQYRLIIGVYRAADQARFTARSGLFGRADHIVIKQISIR